MTGPLFGLFAAGWVLVAAGTALTPAPTLPTPEMAERACSPATGRLMDECLARINTCMEASIPGYDPPAEVRKDFDACAAAATR